jgi:hypothetical protein
MMNIDKLVKDYETVVDETNQELKEMVKQYERLVIPEGSGALLADYLKNADQFNVASQLSYAYKVENQMDSFRKPGAVPQAAQATWDFVNSLGPRLLEFNLRVKGMIA